ncbi:RDD family protein [Candidatus Poriferisocius sp.]|uniref:RDD family protein n=1 Tax=Candidatus Poriferisocius sp. TaxID=3101276 RepID=UPI003B01A00D
MTDQPQPPEPDDTSAADTGHGRKMPVKRVVLGTGETMVLAGYVQRLCARIADTFVYVIGLVVLWQIDVQALSVDDELFVLAISFAPIINEVMAVARSGRTLGMQLFDIRIVSKNTGKKPSVTAALLRWVFQILLFLPILADDTSEFGGALTLMAWITIASPWWFLVHFSVYLGERRRGWHDLISGTVVVTAAPPVPAGPPSGDTA